VKEGKRFDLTQPNFSRRGQVKEGKQFDLTQPNFSRIEL
jgi:hypothetical protein